MTFRLKKQTFLRGSIPLVAFIRCDRCNIAKIHDFVSRSRDVDVAADVSYRVRIGQNRAR